MTALGVLGWAVLSLASGAALIELVTVPLRLIERALISVVVALTVAPAATYGLALAFGLSAATVLLAPTLLLAVCAGLLLRRQDPVSGWRGAWRESRDAWRVRAPRAMLWTAAVATAIFAFLFAHTLFMNHGDLDAGFQTVWADWSQHLSTESSFAVAGNISTANPLFAGTPLLYPFVADFQSATLATLGVAPEYALALPGLVLAVAITLLVVRLAVRLGLRWGAGVIAAAVTFIGGGLGFVGVFADACRSAGSSAAQCTLQHVVSNPGDAARVVAGALRSVPGVIAAQPRPYDALLSGNSAQPLPDMQWYTPLFSWWLPQRTLLYGFATALCILLLVAVAVRHAPRSWSAFAVAGVLMGILPVVHAQTFIALAIMLVVIALAHRRAEWFALAAIALLIALPRLVQIALAPHGSSAGGNAYPWLEPGWMSNAVQPTATGSSVAATPGATFAAVGGALRAVLTPTWWGFWFVNLGVAVPITVLVGAASLLRFARGRASDAARRLLSPFPRPVVDLLLGGLCVFAVCNVVVFQSWVWDNTKLFVYWYLAAALTIGALVARWWSRGVVRQASAAAVVVVTTLTGVVVLLRLLPWTPPPNSVGGPYTVASADERVLASTVAARTPRDAVFLTYGRPNDPLLTAAGRTSLLGYYGWLWSYGVDFGTRVDDIRSMYRGCTSPSGCAVPSLLREYHVGFVEVDDRRSDPGAIEPDVNLAWWSSQGFPVVARSEHIVVYDVRRP